MVLLEGADPIGFFMGAFVEGEAHQAFSGALVARVQKLILELSQVIGVFA
jgi:hypothetical protein